MQNPDTILGIIESKAKNTEFKYRDLYKHLCNVEFYKKAYAKIYHKEGNMTAGSDGTTIDGFSMDKVQNLITSIRNETYVPKPSRRVMIDKKNSTKKRPLGIPAFYDKLVQEILRSILEAIYEPNFSEMSHGFRPDKSCHTALKQVKVNFTGVKWWVEGDIKGFFDNIDHHVLINILRKRIEDERFIRLIWKFLRAGYVYEGQTRKTYGGTPQGGIVSPILANIYLNELDMLMEKKIKDFTKGKTRRADPKYKVISERIHNRMKILKKPDEEETKKLKLREEELIAERTALVAGLPKGELATKNPNWRRLEKKLRMVRLQLREVTPEVRKATIEEIKALEKERRNMPAVDNFDPNYKRMKYVRYADDFLVGIIGNKEDAEALKKDLTEFLDKELKLELSQEKTFITHNKGKVRFLGYDIFIANNNDKVITTQNGSGRDVKIRTLNGGVKLSIPHDILKEFVIGNGYAKDTGTGAWKETHRPNLLNNEPLEILAQYNSELRGFYQYYKLAFDVREKLLNIHWLWIKSLTKTLAGKHKTKVSKLMTYEVEHKGKKFKKYYRNGTWGVAFERKGKLDFRTAMAREEIQFEREIFKIDPLVNLIPPKGIYYGRTSIIQRLNANECELCGDKKGPFEVHHVRKLKDLTKKPHLEQWEKFLIARNRKTMVLCGIGSKNNCHRKLHNGHM